MLTHPVTNDNMKNILVLYWAHRAQLISEPRFECNYMKRLLCVW
jgi:hypothetical protein